MKLWVYFLFFIIFARCETKPLSLGISEEEKPKPAPAPSPAGEPSISAKKPEVNTRFLILRPFFQKSLTKPIHEKVNIFKSNLASFALIGERAFEEVTIPVEEQKKSPLEYYDAGSYSLKMIISGTPIPKALVEDPKGKAYIIEEGTKIGTKEGKVEKITQYEVIILEPDRPPIIKSLTPSAFYLISEFGGAVEIK